MPGGIGFTAAGIRPGPRDGVIGWSADARVADIARVVCNHRFLLLPGVRVKGLASRVLRLAAGRIADDRASACGERPVPVQGFTGPGRGVEVLPGTDVGTAFVPAPRGLAQAAGGGPAPGSVP